MKKKSFIFSTPISPLFIKKLTKKRRNTKIIFAGEWCQQIIKKEFLSKNKIKTIPYPINNYHDEKKLFKILLKNYLVLLDFFKTFLNSYHSVDRKKEYWEIIIGHWLFDSLALIYEKYLIVKKFKNSSNSYFFITNNKSIYFNNSSDFTNNSISHEWNNSIFHFFFTKLKKKIRFKLIKKERKNKKKKLPSFKFLVFFKKVIIKLFSIFSMKFRKDNEIFIINSYLGFFNEIKLQKRINGFYKINSTLDFCSKNQIDHKTRNKVIQNLKGGEKKFLNLIKFLLIKNIPKSYLEDYKDILNFSLKLPWPQKTKKIFTANNILYDDIFKIWCAELKKNNSKLIYCMHGGGYQTELFSFTNYYLNKVSDKIFIWGRNDKLSNKEIKLFNIKSSFSPFNLFIKTKLSEVKILVVQDFPYFYKIRSFSNIINFNKLKHYVNFQVNFIKKLNKENKKKIIIRLGSYLSSNTIDYEKNIWLEKYKNVFFQSRLVPIEKSLANSYVVIINHFSSTLLLECLTSLKPFLILINLKNSLYSSNFNMLLAKLLRRNILFDDPVKLADFLNNMNPNEFMQWWSSKSTQDLILHFRENYAAYNSNPLNSISKKLLDI